MDGHNLGKEHFSWGKSTNMWPNIGQFWSTFWTLANVDKLCQQFGEHLVSFAKLNIQLFQRWHVLSTFGGQYCLFFRFERCKTAQFLWISKNATNWTSTWKAGFAKKVSFDTAENEASKVTSCHTPAFFIPNFLFMNMICSRPYWQPCLRISRWNIAALARWRGWYHTTHIRSSASQNRY